MKKLKRFVLNDSRVLSHEELSLVEGSLSLNLVDNCSEDTKGQACVLSCSYTDGHSCVCIGYCQAKYEQQGSKIIAISSCV